jgi:pyridoxamine 5'-phosphate oxidase
MGIADLRREYRTGGLARRELATDPLAQFQNWFSQAAATQSGGRWRKIGIALFKLWQALLNHPPADVNAMVLATATIAGAPSARTVLLKGVDGRGFIFFTNYESRKAREIAENSSAALVFYWPDLERQVCVAGKVTQLPGDESDAYFRSRPRGSRIGAWASNQSAAIASRAALEQQWAAVAAKYPDDVPRPPNWGGFVLDPARIEFWQGRPSRLHDRFCYTPELDGTWKLDRLSP